MFEIGRHMVMQKCSATCPGVSDSLRGNLQISKIFESEYLPPRAHGEFTIGKAAIAIGRAHSYWNIPVLLSEGAMAVVGRCR